MYIVYLLIVVLLILGIIGKIEDAIKSKKIQDIIGKIEDTINSKKVTREVISYVLGIIGVSIGALIIYFLF